MLVSGVADLRELRWRHRSGRHAHSRATVLLLWTMTRLLSPAGCVVARAHSLEVAEEACRRRARRG